MAITTGTGLNLYRTANLPNHDADYTFMCWAKANSWPGYGTPAHIWELGTDNTFKDEVWFINMGDNSWAVGAQPAGWSYGEVMSTGVWYHCCIVRSATNLRTGYLNGASSLTATGDVSGRDAPTRMEMGCGIVSDEQPFDGVLAAIKIWTAALTLAEVQNEMYSMIPRRTANLHSWSPVMPGSGERGRDYSGNGYNWSEGGSLSDVHGPPIPWSVPMPYYIPLPPAYIEGTTVWGHNTGATETNKRTFATNWTGTGTIMSSGDTEYVELHDSEYMESEIVKTDLVNIELKQNQYRAGDNVDLYYKTGSDPSAFGALLWNEYLTPFLSEGYVKVRIQYSEK